MNCEFRASHPRLTQIFGAPQLGLKKFIGRSYCDLSLQWLIGKDNTFAKLISIISENYTSKHDYFQSQIQFEELFKE